MATSPRDCALPGRVPGRTDGWLQQLMDHVESQVTFGDTKAALLLTADAVLVGGLTAMVGEAGLLQRMGAPAQVLVVAGIGALVAGVVLALVAVLPSRRNLWPGKAPTRSVFSFAWLARQQPEEVLLALREADEADLDEQLALVVHGKACWARRKFVRLYAAVVATVLGVSCAVAAATVHGLAALA